MCGRFACSEIPKPLADCFGITVPDDLPARRNIAPSMPIAALIRDDESHLPVLGWLHWGLVPFWTKDRAMGANLFNARAETAHEKPSFRAAFRHHRCLIPADAFYEWKREGVAKVPYRISLPGGPMVFAGLWDTWNGPGEELLLSCTILTTAANTALRAIHDRMPVILPPERWHAWMDPKLQHERDLAPLLEPWRGDLRIEEGAP